MKKTAKKILALMLFFAVAIPFVIKFASPMILRAYVETGMSSTKIQPLFSTVPTEELNISVVDGEYLKRCDLIKFPDLEISIPKDFVLKRQAMIKVAYDKKKRKKIVGDSAVYVFCQKPDFFVTFFPQVKKSGINNDYEFLSRMMNAQSKQIVTLTDAFFCILKVSLTPYLGDEKQEKIIKFTTPQRKGYITCNLSETGNYFDCNYLDEDNNFLKLYIKDMNKSLDMNKVCAILSGVHKIDKKN